MHRTIASQFRRAAKIYQCYVHIVDAQYVSGMTHTRWCAITNESCIQFDNNISAPKWLRHS